MLGRFAIAAMLLGLATGVAEAAPPNIRTDGGNMVPRCVTPKRLMAFLKTRNSNLDPRFANIASLYKRHGEAWNVRWDYAFFQMAVETNFLTYRKGNGGWGDVNPKQNNFAGLGTTGGGVPGDTYPDVNTGVLAQIQHLVVYSGERIEDPVGARTKLKQDDIIETMASKKGRTTFADLSRRWAADRHYGASIEWVANNFRQSFCKGPDPVEEAETTARKPVKRTAAAQPLAPAANLGGPADVEAEPVAETKHAPVRTIWSAADGPTTPGTISDAAEAAPEKTAPTARAAPVPTRKPAAETAAVAEPVTEQIIQTGEETPPTVEVASAATEATSEATSAPAPASEPTPAATPATGQATPEAPPAFAFAGAMSSALPKPAAAPKVAAAGGNCRVLTASYGGKKVLLVRSKTTAEERYTVLTVLEGFEKSMLDSYLKAHAPGGSSVGEFENKDAAFAKAKELCPSAAAAPTGEGASAG
jgi:hypothetical protein